LEDKDIISYIKGGDKRIAIESLYKLYGSKVQRYVVSKGASKSDAEDLFQDALLAFYKKAIESTLEETFNIGGFLMSTAKNIWYSQLKRKEMMVRHHEVIVYTGEKSNNDYLYDYTPEREKLMDAILSSVGKSCHQLLKLVLYDNLSLREIADEMGYSSEDVAKMTHYRCKKKLIAKIKDKKHLKELLQVE
jgi:RNA polymerase sigma factor (sigma-70 family)